LGSPDTKKPKRCFHLLSGLPFIHQFYLAGGTGLALYIGHRFSVDLDFFSAFEETVNPDHRAALRNFLDDPSLVITYDKDSTFVAQWRGVGISFFRLHLYPLVQSPVLLEGVPVASLPEIGAMKLAAIIDRGTRRDLVIFILFTADTFRRFVSGGLYQICEGAFFSSKRYACAAYFEDAEALPMPVCWTALLGDNETFSRTSGNGIGHQRLADLWD